ncbi:unnamed protein product [Polarella glacialis]|uniref:Uncharacterized protein n=1 Tax=Polarella glacialis TaxID=89957 RepID=A0A813GG00_POLGL|nr:unnamed protein product [Polarella glacialis]
MSAAVAARAEPLPMILSEDTVQPAFKTRGSETWQSGTTKEQRPTRRRAPPSGRDLSPGMTCPLGAQSLQLLQVPGQPLGLCGPSELQGCLVRQKAVLRADQLHRQLPKRPAPGPIEGLLQRKLTYLARAIGVEVMTPLMGRTDLAELIMSFVPEERPLVRTETDGVMYRDSGSCNLDLFFQALPQAKPAENLRLRELLQKAWQESPETCLRQIFHLGASREGKQDRYSCYDALFWLWETQPATVLANLHLLPATNYWKGLLELLARVCEGPQRSLERDVALHERFLSSKDKLVEKDAAPQGHVEKDAAPKGTPPRFLINNGRLVEKDGAPKKSAGRKNMGTPPWQPGSRLELAKEALRRYDEDPLYRALFERTGQLFAERLRADLEDRRRGRRIGLCAKWCPLLYHSFDRRTLICECIARWLFPATLPEFEGVTERQYAYRARDRLRSVLSDLKEYTKLPERLMCQQRWSEIDYNRVPATCMKIHAKQFAKHDPVRFQTHVDNMLSGKAKAKTGALQPHQLLKGVQRAKPDGTPIQDTERQVAQAQWEALVDQVRSWASLEDCIAVCDVSGSMDCKAGAGASCMDVAIAMSLLLAEVSVSRSLITFHETPQLVRLPATKQLDELDSFARALPWGGATNFYKVFELLLTAQPMPKRVFVFSDMQFSQAAGGNKGDTDLRRAQKLFAERGLQMPQLVFWNLSASVGSPALASDEGVALLSGFSAALLRTLLKEGKMDPIGMFCKALDTPLLRKPRVVYKCSEALQLFKGPEKPSPKLEWTPEPQVPLADAPSPPKTPSKKTPLAVLSLSLGSLPFKDSVAAFIGRKGEGVQALRAKLLQQLRQRLQRSVRGLRLWLDVRTHSLPPPNFEHGEVEVSVEAQSRGASLEELSAAVETLRSLVSACIEEAKLRARAPRPRRPRRQRPRRPFPVATYCERETRTFRWCSQQLAKRRHTRRAQSKAKKAKWIKQHPARGRRRAKKVVRLSCVASGKSVRRHEHCRAAHAKARATRKDLKQTACRCRRGDDE